MPSVASPEFSFKIEKESSQGHARLGRLSTPHGSVTTPAFMPVGTQGTVKALTPEDLKVLGVEMLLCNTYHLYLRPGIEIIQTANGLHNFIHWNLPLLTDSGGFQVFSLESLRRVNDMGVEFRSHIDGSQHFFTPEKIIALQLVFGADIIMCFDECPPYPVTLDYARQTVQRTLNWAKRGQEQYHLLSVEKDLPSSLFGIVQGSTFPELRRESALETRSLNFPGYALGGFSVGEPRELAKELIPYTLEFLPEDRPRYLMGVGKPGDIWENIQAGIDLFDCVLPTRNARNGQLFTFHGKLNLKNAFYRNQFIPVDEQCPCLLCQQYSRAYLHHLFRSGEISAARLATLHNLTFMVKLLNLIKKSIENDIFMQEKNFFYENYQKNREDNAE